MQTKKNDAKKEAISHIKLATFWNVKQIDLF
jgi:hypothetical protein